MAQPELGYVGQMGMARTEGCDCAALFILGTGGDGNCRLMATFAVRLAETASMWARAVAPTTEWVARQLWSRQKKDAGNTAPPTRLTQGHKRVAKGKPSLPRPERAPRLQNICHTCGADIPSGNRFCPKCNLDVARENMLDIARTGRTLAHTPEAQVRRGNANRKHMKAVHAWKPSDNPSWLTEETYRTKIYPRLAEHTVPSIAAAIKLSEGFAADIRAGRHRPHPRHWQALARLIGIPPGP